jgi:hypothetical protein
VDETVTSGKAPISAHDACGAKRAKATHAAICLLLFFTASSLNIPVENRGGL